MLKLLSFELKTTENIRQKYHLCLPYWLSSEGCLCLQSLLETIIYRVKQTLILNDYGSSSVDVLSLHFHTTTTIECNAGKI